MSPRLSLWRPKKDNDYIFADRSIGEHIYIGGTGIFIHKYVGIYDQDGNTKNTRDIVAETKIQDLLFLENRDRKYDKNVYDIRGVYTPQDNDFDLTQFGLFLTADVIYVTFHLNNQISILGRKLMSGDVLEFPHLLDDTGLDNSAGPVRKFYVIEDVIREAAGFDANWWPHLIRVKCQTLQDTVEYRDILEDDGVNDLKSILSTYNNELDISTSILEQANADVPKHGFETGHLFFNEIDQKKGVFVEDGIPDNGGVIVGRGTTFPADAEEDAYYLRTDFTPHRLFKKKDGKWVKIEDDKRGVWSSANKVLNTFLNNPNTLTDQDTGKSIPSKQGISKVIKPKSDF